MSMCTPTMQRSTSKPSKSWASVRTLAHLIVQKRTESQNHAYAKLNRAHRVASYKAVSQASGGDNQADVSASSALPLTNVTTASRRIIADLDIPSMDQFFLLDAKSIITPYRTRTKPVCINSEQKPYPESSSATIREQVENGVETLKSWIVAN